MIDTLLLDIAGLIVALESADAVLMQRLHAQYAGFIADRATAPLLTISIETTPGAAFLAPQPGSFLTIDVTYTAPELHFVSHQERGTLAFDRQRGWLEMAPDAHIENFLRVTYAWLALHHDGLLLHAAGVVRDGCGYVFIGPSGAGKSTISRLAAKQATVFSDDLVMIRRIDGQYRLCGVPFRGSFAIGSYKNESAPLDVVLRLRQANCTQITPLTTATAIATLSAGLPFVNSVAGVSTQLLANCMALTASVPSATLHFKRDDQFWSVIDDYFAPLSATTCANGGARD